MAGATRTRRTRTPVRREGRVHGGGTHPASRRVRCVRRAGLLQGVHRSAAEAGRGGGGVDDRARVPRGGSHAAGGTGRVDRRRHGATVPREIDRFVSTMGRCWRRDRGSAHPDPEPARLRRHDHGSVGARAPCVQLRAARCATGRTPRRAPARHRTRPARGGRDRPGAALHAAVGHELRGGHRPLSAGVMHDEVQPQSGRDRRGAARVPTHASPPARLHDAGDAGDALAPGGGAV